MALRTKNAIRRSFIELLAERPFDKISVRDIAERSEVTRNTFYYYYTDIYALAEDVFESEIEKLSERVEGYDSWQKAFLTATSFAAENKRMILHLHNSAHSDILARYYHKTILTTMLSYIRKEAEGLNVSESQIMALARFYTAALAGLTLEKLKEATASVLPISLIVMAISFVLVPVDAGLMLSFVIATAMLILGMGLFTLGADMSMSRIGNYMGSKLTKSRKLPLILTVSFALGVAITVAEPDLQVLAGNVPEIDTTVLILTVSVGVGFFLMLCMVRILFSISLRTMLIVFYAIVFAAAFLSDESILSVAFDSGGVTTGPMTVPFIMALGVGVASIRSDENAKADSFGLVGLCSIGPILSVLLLGAIYKTQPAQGESGTVSGVATTVELGKDYLHALPEYLWEVTMALLPIVVFFLIFQVISLKLRKLPFMRIVIGILYTYLGLVLFLTGVNVGFSPLGYALGAALAEGWKVYLLAPLAMLMGWFIINAEPAVHTLNKQVEELSAGAISAKAMGMSLSIAVSAAGGLAMLRVITGISIMYFLVPGYLIALALSFFVPRTFTAIAFDSGGVASGPLTATFMLPFATGACEALGGNVMTDAFGLVALVAMMPLITVQVMGAIYVVKSRHASQEPQLPDFGDNEIIELWEAC